MKQTTDTYEDVNGNRISLADLDAGERRLVALVVRKARAATDWDAFDNWWTNAIVTFYRERGLPQRVVSRTVLWRIAQDQSGRVAVSNRCARFPDYRDELEDLIRDRFQTQRAFCAATGISEDLLSHVLAGRKDLSLDRLTKALARIGYRLRIRPAEGDPPGLRHGRTTRAR
jgi:hypothetical protein